MTLASRPPRPGVATSTSHPLRVDWLPYDETAPGSVGLTMAPGRRGHGHASGLTWDRSLVADVRALEAEGVALVVCLLDWPEFMSVMGVTHSAYRGLLRSAGIELAHAPIVDGGAPKRPLAHEIRRVHRYVDRSRNVVIHCAAGLGRSGLFAGAWLRSSGMRPDRVLDVLRETRGPLCPENDRQKDFVRRWPRV